MKARKFNGLMPVLNEAWSARVLGMRVNEHWGVDLIGSRCVSEIKFCLDNGRYSLGWTVQEHQMKYPEDNSDMNPYWGLGLYYLSEKVKDINAASSGELERFVVKRELWMVPWDWMRQFPPHETRGETKKTEWHYIFRYPKKSLMPTISRSYETEGGVVHLTQGVDGEDFLFLEDGIPI